MVRTQFGELTQRIREATGDRRTPEQVAEGFVDIAVGNMANAIKQISVQRGHDVTEHTLCCFGGAAGPARLPGGRRPGDDPVFIHPLAGVLSAYGMGLAEVTAMREQAVEARLEPGTLHLLDEALEKLAVQARDELRRQGVPQERVQTVKRVHLRYDGTDSALIVGFGPIADMVRQFEAAYRTRYSFLMPIVPSWPRRCRSRRSASPMRPRSHAAGAAPPWPAASGGHRRHACRRHMAAHAGLPPRRPAAG